MKTLQELYNERLQSEELKKSFTEAIQGGKVEDFLKAHGREAGKGAAGHGGMRRPPPADGCSVFLGRGNS